MATASIDTTVQAIFSPIVEEMVQFKSFFREHLLSQQPILKDITRYLCDNEGKQLRPILVLLAAKTHGTICKSSYIAASAIEMIHTATLIHDDVVDSSDTRRGRISVQAKWSPQVAILTGDYLLAKALQITTQNSEFELLDLVTNAVKEMSEGELIQIDKSKTLDTTEEDYYSIIYKKTASLIAACAATGTHSVNKSTDVIDTMKEMGKHIGIAFQIRDDIFDYQKNNLIGKPVGNDIRENKLTLPLIHALRKSNESTQRQILATLVDCRTNKERVPEIVDFVVKNNGIDYAESVMAKHCEEAKYLLTQFPKNDASSSLRLLIEYTASRKK